jgi:hypothetical protein
MSEDYQVYIVQLKSDVAKERYEAVCWLARYRATDDWREIYEAVWDRAENDPDKRVSSAAGIAGSMISARNCPLSMFADGSVPDFLGPWNEGGTEMIQREMTPDEWKRLNQNIFGNED